MRGLMGLAVLAVSLVFATAAAAERRVALVIGNSKYDTVSELANPTKDAAAVDRTLRAIGFDVRLVEDLDQRDLLKALKAFSDAAAGADTALIYYAGHGVEVDGRNYLVPTDAVLAKATDVEFEAILLDNVRTAVSGASKLRLVILDACRNNPFKLTNADDKPSVGRGLSRVEPGANELVAYAAREGTCPSDGTGKENGPYAAALVKYLVEPGLEIRLLFSRVRDEVMSTTGQAQEPFVYGSLGGEALYLNPPTGLSPFGKSPNCMARGVAQCVD